MKFNPKLKGDIAKYQQYVIIVEGKKHVAFLNSLGFDKVHEIHKNDMTIQERAAQISRILDKKDKICILTDFDKRGKTLYFQLKEIFQELGVKTDSTLRGLLLVGNVSHIEDLKDFFHKAHHY